MDHSGYNGVIKHSEDPDQEAGVDYGYNSDSRGCCECLCLQKCSKGIVTGLESIFYRIGFTVARHPIKVIVISALVSCIAGIGLMKWKEETEYVNVWLPRGSRMYEEYLWVQNNFPDSVRFESVIIRNENILTPKSINAMYDLYKKANDFVVQGKLQLKDFCIISGPMCRVNSILELWHYNETLIRNLTQSMIYDRINQPKIISPVFLNEMNLDKVLGNVLRDNRSRIVGAEAATMFWYLEPNDTDVEAAKEWEKKLIDHVNDVGHVDLEDIYIYTTRTFDDEGIGANDADRMSLTMGFGLVFLYICFTIGRCSFVEQKIFLGLAGLLSIGMSITFTYGIGFGAGIMFGPIHQITPFMILGIGVDDMFVIMESLRNLTPKQKQLPVEERIALTLKQAGVSITVTSITDIVAFGIGSTTVIPSLSTFCVYAAIGVLALYVLQATYFVACLTLDERRIDANRNACICCFKHGNSYKPNKYYTFSVQQWFMKNAWGPLLTKLPVKIVVIIIALGLVGVNTWSFTQLKHDFDPSMYLPTNSYSQKYVKADRKYFPDDGAFVYMYCGEIDYLNNLDNLLDIYRRISSKPSVQRTTVDFWLASFQRWLNASSLPGVPTGNNSTAFSYQPYDFYTYLQQFLMTDHGRVYLRNLKLDNMTSPRRILGSVLTFRHVKCTNSQCSIIAMDDMRDLVDNYQFRGGGTCFVYSNPQYMFNETNKVLKLELYRNLALAAVCVFVVTLILIANFWTSVLVFICVVFTVIDVAGTMQFWDISIDTASSVILILCFGLAVDYSAHVGHSFMTVRGTNNERTKKTLIKMGPAVFSGGFSTFLAFLLLVNSVSYGFTLFFRIFTSVVIFGLFHGLTFLPVILSLIGPRPYTAEVTSDITSSSAKYSDTNGGPSCASKQQYTDIMLTELEVKKPLNGELCNNHVDHSVCEGLDTVNYNPRKKNGTAKKVLKVACQCQNLQADQPCIQDHQTVQTVFQLYPALHASALAKRGIIGKLFPRLCDPEQRYSGSYYEQMSNGSLVQIPMLDSPPPYVKAGKPVNPH